ncbi:MAG TPA: metallophosphoesterase [Methylococcaceae bacterium]|nr:metallophosphoesterase [Methylococcaceae bacterium]
MKINFFSDIHLEFGPMPLPLTDADIIVAAGDIGVGRQGVDWLRNSIVPVVYVAGNHEFYGGEYDETLRTLRRQAIGTPVNFLQNEYFILEDVRFLGCTLWTNLGDGEGGKLEDMRAIVNDFKQIRHGKRLLMLSDYILKHQASLAWLEEELSRPFHGPTVVVTHHAPLPNCWKGLSHSLKRFAYCNDLHELMERFDIPVWIHGHTHFLNDIVHDRTRVLCNPRGYNGQGLVKGFDPCLTIEI